MLGERGVNTAVRTELAMVGGRKKEEEGRRKKEEEGMPGSLGLKTPSIFSAPLYQ
jgi:hypothetical protein